MRICLGCMEHYEEQLTKCPFCGYAAETPADEATHMPPGTILSERYIVGRALGFGGFGVTYIGWDAQLERKVAIKEYLPSEFSTRVPGQTTVTIFTDSKKLEQYESGLAKFLDEAQRLAQFQGEEGIVSIYDSFEDNNTAYIVMECLEGETLATRLKREGKYPAKEAAAMLLPVIHSLERVHKQGIIHRDIAPDNIFLTKDGKVKLIDFGAARYAMTLHSRSLTVIIKPGYSPEEQYRSRGDQGPHSDVYALGAVLYRMVTGETPPDAMERRAFFEGKKKDILKSPRKLSPELSENEETAILNALNVRIEDRTPNMDALAGELTSEAPVRRRYGKIAKIDVLKWPLWAKIGVPLGIVAVATLSAFFAMGIIGFDSLLQTSMKIPDSMSRVPSIVNNELTAAEERLAEASLYYAIGDKQYSTIIPTDYVLKQDLSAGSVVPVNSTVSVVISAGAETKAVPDVVGESLEQVRLALENLGFTVKTMPEYSSQFAEGDVIAQDIAGGSEYEVGGTITLRVSMGPDPLVKVEKTAITAPNLVGRSLNAAFSLAQSEGFVASVASREYSDSVAKDVVISQSPGGGSAGMTGDVIKLVVSLGARQSRVPDVQYKTLEEARALLEAEGLVAAERREKSETVARDHVISQNPAPKTLLAWGGQVSMVISDGGSDLEVPNVVGMLEAEARAALSAAGFMAEVQYEKNDSVAEGGVFRQNPSPGAKISRGSLVALVVSSGKLIVPVPDVTGWDKGSAQDALKTAGFKVTVNEIYSDEIMEGIVVSMSPSAGSQQQSGSAVIITVSQGPEPVPVPDVSGQSQSMAEKTLRDMGLNPVVETEYHDTVPAGSVSSQIPNAGNSVAKGSTVILRVSLGVKTDNVPDLVGQSRTNAETALTKLGLNLTLTVTEEYSDAYPVAGTVIAQSPWAGTAVKKGDSVTLVVSRGAIPLSVPNVVGKPENDAQAELTGATFRSDSKPEYSETVAEGAVIAQNPAANAKAYKNDVIHLTVSRGRKPIPAPDLVGRPWASNKNILETEGLKTNSTEAWSETVAQGSVISQDTAAGTILHIGDALAVVVSKGREPKVLENYSGQNINSVRSDLGGWGLTVGDNREYSETVANDVIIGQSPASGITVHKGDTVSFRVSKGREPFPVPNVVGKTLSEAQSVISAGNLAASEGSRQWSETVPEGSVISQEPSGGTLYRNGAVSLVVSKGREPWTVANYVGQQISSVRPAMENFGLSVSVTEFYSDTVPAGQISAQNPSAGPILYKGGSISFEVSRGPETRVVPTVTGSNYTSAQSALQGADLAVTIDSSHSSSVARGNVISQNPAAGASVRKGSAVTITVSRGVADSGWVDSLPSGVDTGGYDIQERTVWRYRDQKDEGGWGSWSGWSANAVSASGTRQVETRWIEPTYKTIWHYERWKYWNSAAGRYESGAGSSWTDGYPSTYEEIWLEYALNHTGTLDSGRKRYGSHGEPSIIRDWWWNENSYQEIATPGRTEYHYRDWIPKLTWGNWSSWSTTQVTASGTRQVESATQYMYSGKPIP